MKKRILTEDDLRDVENSIENIDINQFDAIDKGSQNFNTLREPGVFRLWNSSTSPCGTNADYIMVVYKHNNNIIQVAHSSTSTSSIRNKVYVRSYYNSTWTNWRELTNTEIEKEIEKKADKDAVARTSTIVIANYDSHDNSKKAADIVINRGENASTKINNAIQSLRNTGGEIKLMEGIYTINSKISILSDNIAIKGVGKGTVLKAERLPSGTRESIIEVGANQNTSDNQVYGVDIFDLVIDGNNTKEDYRGIHLWGSTNSTISNVACNNNQANGIQLSNKSSATISNVECSNNKRHGVGVYGDSSATISNVKCANNADTGIAFFANSSATISNVECSNNKLHGVGFYNTTRSSISNSRIYGNGEAGCDIMVAKGSHFISNNHLGTDANTSGWGIFIRDSSISSVVANNVLVDDYKVAMIVDNGHNTITELSGNVGV